MKKSKLLLVFVLLLSTVLLLSSCTNIMTMFGGCSVHRDLNKDTVCDVCGATVPVNCTAHLDKNHDGKCDTEGCTVTFNVTHRDLNHDGKCDEELCTKSDMAVSHKDNDEDGKCDVCGKKMNADCEHIDEDEDGFCDECEEEIEEEPCDECVDEDGDGKCDECGSDVEGSGACEHADANFDGKCDTCKEEIEGAVAIYSNKKLNFTFVVASGSPSDHAMAVGLLAEQLRGLGLTVEEGMDTKAAETEYEIIFGSPKNRDAQYQLDPHEYGMNGYAIKLIGTKIIVVGGSDQIFNEALNTFKETFLGLTSSTKKLTARYITEAQNVSEVQDDYDVSKITLEGNDIKGYTIAADKEETVAYNTARDLQNLLYSRTGYWLDIVALEEAENSIVIDLIERSKDYSTPGFTATFSDGKIEFISEYASVINNKVINFFTVELAKAKTGGTLTLSDKNNATDDVRFVYYEDFGAKGDGHTDDSEAIRAAHEYANEGGHKVIANSSRTYYIGKLESAIQIKTDVDWGKAKFIIDDSSIEPLEKTPDGSKTYRSVNIFSIPTSSVEASDKFINKKNEINASGGIDASKFTSFEVEFGEPLLIVIRNTNHKNYVRYGVNASDGASQVEVVLVNEHGDLDPTTPFMHDFEQINGYALYKVNHEPITIEGGEFTTKPYTTDTPQAYNAYARGIACSRSNVTFKNVKHFLADEGAYSYNNHDTTTDYGCPYGGFFSTDYSNNVVYDNCQFAAHIVYKGSNGAGMGTYDLSPGYAINVLYKNCYQEDDNFFNRTYGDNGGAQNRWGVMGSSYCKNVTFQDCKLTRFDAHNGIHNAFIINTEIKMIRVNGTGNFVMDNCIMHSTTLVGLREDYGGFWDGNIILKNNKMIGAASVTLFTNTWYNHYFGYPPRYASNIVIDGLTLYRSVADYEANNAVPPSESTVTLFNSGILTGAAKIVQDYLPVTDSAGNATYYKDRTPIVVANKCQATAPERITFRNLEGYNIVVPNKTEYTWFENTSFIINETESCAVHFDHIPDGKCDDCGADFTPCTECVDANNDEKCVFCGGEVEIVCESHIDKELNGHCDICDAHYVCNAHIDADRDRICDKCGGVLGCKDPHYDAAEDGYCDVCTKLIPTCETCVDLIDIYKREIPDCKCDVCGADILTMGELCETCVDADTNGKCDVCGANVEVTCTHTDTDPVDNKCDSCGEDMPAES